MRETRLKLWEVACLASTRAMLGGGIALLVADRLAPDLRRRAGWTLFGIGAASTLPLLLRVRRNTRVVREGRFPFSGRRGRAIR